MRTLGRVRVGMMPFKYIAFLSRIILHYFIDNWVCERAVIGIYVMSEYPDWELFYHNILSLLDYVQKEDTPRKFNLL